jgi:hypothetical protein
MFALILGAYLPIEQFEKGVKVQLRKGGQVENPYRSLSTSNPSSLSTEIELCVVGCNRCVLYVYLYV